MELSTISNPNNDIERIEIPNIKSAEKTSGPPKKKSFFWDHFVDFSSHTTFHGVQYFGESGRPTVEKIWWAICLPVCIAFLIMFSYNIYAKWDKSPVIISAEETPTFTYDIPFPAITICSNIKTKNEKFSFRKTFKNLLDGDKLNDNDLLKFSVISQFCKYESFKSVANKLKNDTSYENSTIIQKVLEEVTPMFSDFLFSCEWADNTDENCNNLFTPVLTDQGICYTFNFVPEMLDRENIQDIQNHISTNKNSSIIDWNSKVGYLNKEVLLSYPKRTPLVGKHFQFRVVLTTNREDVDLNCEKEDAIKVKLHSPTVFPQLTEDYISVPVSKETDIKIKPAMIKTAQNLETYLPERRKCYFNNERKLKYFNLYSEENCLYECQINMTYALCDCVSYTMPHSKGMRICGPNKYKCLYEAKIIEYNMTLELLSEEGEIISDLKNNCKCLPECMAVNYLTDIFTRPIDVAEVSRSENFEIEGNYSTTVLNFYFKERKFTAQQRNELYGASDFVSNFGGLLGLFIGGSVVSCIDLLYFYSIRLFNDLRRIHRTIKQYDQFK